MKARGVIRNVPAPRRSLFDELTGRLAAIPRWFGALPARFDLLADRHAWWLHLLHVGLMATLLFFIVHPGALLLHEYPDWLFQGYLFNQHIFHGKDFGGLYSLHPYLPPNAISTLFIGTVSELCLPSTAGRILLLLSSLAVYFGVYLFTGITVGGRRFLRALIAFSFVFGYHFWLGDPNFSMGFGVALIGAYLLIVHRLIGKIIPAALLFLFCYLCHISSCAILLLAALGWIISERRPALLAPLFAAMIPAVALFVIYAINADLPNPFESPGPATLYRHLHDRAIIVTGSLSPFPAIGWSQMTGEGWHWGNLAYLLLLCGIMALAVRGSRQKQPAGFNTVLVVALAAGVLALPLGFRLLAYPAHGAALFLVANLVPLLLLRMPSSARMLLPAYCLLNLVMGYHALAGVHALSRYVSPCGPTEDGFGPVPPGIIEPTAHLESHRWIMNVEDRRYTIYDTLPPYVNPAGLFRADPRLSPENR